MHYRGKKRESQAKLVLTRTMETPCVILKQFFSPLENLIQILVKSQNSTCLLLDKNYRLEFLQGVNKWSLLFRRTQTDGLLQHMLNEKLVFSRGSVENSLSHTHTNTCTPQSTGLSHEGTPSIDSNCQKSASPIFKLVCI